MNFITVLSCLAVLSVGVWGRRSPEARGALTALLGAGGLLCFFGGFLLVGLLGFGFLGYLSMTMGAFALAVAIPVMHVGAPKIA